MNDIGKFLRQKRKEKGLSQIELAQLSNVSVMSIRRYENNDRSPKADELAKLGNVLGFNVIFQDGIPVIDGEQDVNDVDPSRIPMKDVDYDELDRLLAVRGISRRQLAAMIGISPDTLAGSFRRKGRIRIDYVCKIADCLGVSVESFSSGTSSDYDEFKEYSMYELDSQLAELVGKLNIEGREKLMDAVQILLKVPEYRKE